MTTLFVSADAPGYFVSGTNTEVGKTYVTALLARWFRDRKRSVGVYKPVASGCTMRDGKLHSEDAEQLWLAAGKPQTLEAVTPQCFAAALAPNVAARNETSEVNATLLRSGIECWNDYDVVLVEGVGGLMSPISDHDLVVDLAVDFAFPLIIVAANELGCINSTLQTLAVAESRGLTVAGIVLNQASTDPDASCDSNASELRRWTNVPIATVHWGEETLS